MTTSKDVRHQPRTFFDFFRFRRIRNKDQVSTSLGVSLLIGVLMLVFSAIFGVLLAESVERAVNAAEEESFSLLIQVIHNAFKEEIRFADFGLEALAFDTVVQSAIARSDREALQERLSPYYESIRNRVPRMHIHLPDGQSLLRLHDPGMYGDDLTALRPMISQVVRDNAAVSGFEVGVHGPGLRAIRPVFQDGRYVGSIEIGMDLGSEFLNRLKQRYTGDFSMRFFNADGSVTRHASTHATDLCTTSEESRNRIRQGEPFWLHSCTSVLAVAYYPFRSFDGVVIGYVKAEVPRVTLADSILAHRRNLFITGLTLVGLVTFIAFLSLKVFLKPLHSIVRQTRSISERIIGGDVNVRGNLEKTGSDFRGVIAAVNDIINALRSREVLLQAIIEGIPGVVFYCDSDRTVLWANRRARNLVPEIVGLQVGNPGDPHGFFAQELDLFNMALSTRCVSHVSTCYPAVSTFGTQRSCWEHTAVPILDGETVQHVIRISQDITQKKDAEDQLRALNETLEARVLEETAKRQVQERVAYQQSRLASIGELAAGMAHEINQPLSSIGFAIQNIVRSVEMKQLDRDYLDSKRRLVQDDIERIRRIIDHVRTFAREDQEDFNVSFSVDEAVNGALGLIGEQIRAHGILLDVKLSSASAIVCGNPYQYEQVILNLLSNARFAVEERVRTADKTGRLLTGDDFPEGYIPSIAVVVETGDDVIRLIVEDNGNGVAPEILPKVFDPFFTTKGGNGTGLGLSISFGIIERMGGSIALEPLMEGTRAVAVVPHYCGGCH